MPDKLDVVSRVACLDTVHANSVPVGRVTRLTPVEVMHRKRRITGYLVQTLSVRHCLFHRVLVVEYLVAAHDRLHPASQTQPTEAIVEDLVEFEGGGSVVGYLHTGRQPIEDPVTAQYRMTLGRYQDSSLSVPEDVVLFQDALAAVEDADAAVSAVEDLVTF